jgi:alkanesulfonate monooxygenase SsuD/methylene tetrahydromethanopterin reductase-like flavin-dependent oxidoreductase (luciferase family)
MHSMQLCLMIEGQEGVEWPHWLAIARACEESGIETLYRSDHYLNLDGRHPERGSLDAWGTISALAAVTTTLRLGTLVSPATFRHPSVLAKLVATADHVSGGRIDWGLGAGWHQREHDAHGFVFPPTKERVDVLAEQLEIVFGSWAPGPFSFTGERYRLENLDAQPKPVQRPCPPLIMGGSAGPRSAALAARYAAEYNTPFPTLEDIRARRSRIVEACERAGRDPIPFSVMVGVIVGRDQGEVDDRLRRLAERHGDDAQMSSSEVPAGWVIGTVDAAVEQFTAIADAGAARVMCQHLLHDDTDAIRLLGDTIAPQLG